MTIFHHVDADGDDLQVRESSSDPGSLLFDAVSDGNTSVHVRTPREDVLRLIQALSDWAYPTTLKPTEFDVSKALKRLSEAASGVAAAFLPLHQAPQSITQWAANIRAIVPQAYVPEPDAEEGWTPIGDAVFCTIEGCDRFTNGAHLEHDPEPCGCKRGHHAHVFRPCPHCDCTAHDPAPVGHRACGCLNANHPPVQYTDPDAQPDPEPKDVGHPEAPAKSTDWSDRIWNGDTPCDAPLRPGQILADDCPECGMIWAIHPQAATVALPYCTRSSGGCDHSWGQHTEGACRAKTVVGRRIHLCGCIRVRGEAQ